MLRVQQGDEVALGALMRKWELPLKRLLARIVQNTRDAEEMAQATFVRIWEQRARYRADAEFRPWLFAIGVNMARNRLRWWKRRPEISLDARMEIDPASRENAAPSKLERKELVDAVQRAVAELPLPLREALVLQEYEQLSHAEIAEVLGCTTKAVEGRIHRARERLRGPLAKWLQSETSAAAIRTKGST
jgi:RNA polymerase sigma-70 factor (ECF subfamily)